MAKETIDQLLLGSDVASLLQLLDERRCVDKITIIGISNNEKLCVVTEVDSLYELRGILECACDQLKDKLRRLRQKEGV